jgi:hypothetical protein
LETEGKSMMVFVFIDEELTDLTASDLVKMGVVASGFREFHLGRNDFDESKCNAFVGDEIYPLLQQSPDGLRKAMHLEYQIKEWLNHSSGNASVVAFNYTTDKETNRPDSCLN